MNTATQLPSDPFLKTGVGKRFLWRATFKTLLLSGATYYVYFDYNLQRIKI